MRAPSPLSFHRIAAAATTVTNSPSAVAAVMSTQSPFRGGRRYYSDHPNSANNNTYNAQNYSYHINQNNPNCFNSQNYYGYNAHFNSNNFNNSYNAINYSYPVNQTNQKNFNVSYNAQNYSYGMNQSYQFHSGNNNNITGRGRGGDGGNFGNRGNNNNAPSYNRSKPADFRTWEFAKDPPPNNSERFVVLSYNILADYLANGHRKLYFHIPRRFMSWEWRKSNILFELKLWSPDIMCLQEVDKFQELEEDLRVRGYSGFWKMRTGEAVDGCAIFFRATRFKLMFEDFIEFNKHGMRDNVAQICVLESLSQNQGGDQISCSSSGGPNRVVVCNIHVLYNPRRGEMKLGQVRMLLEKAQAVSKTWDDAPIVLCGDFNCTPKSPLYNFISEQKLDISHVKRDKVSGQASCEIHPPARVYGHHTRGQPAGNMANLTMTPNNILEKEIRDNDNLKNSQSDNSCSSSALNHDKTDENLIGLSLNKKDESLEGNDDFGEGTEEALSELRSSEAVSPHNLGEVVLKADVPVETVEFLSGVHNGEAVSPPNLGEVIPKADRPVEGRTLYDPSLWTAMEIATANGNTDITILEHPLKLCSTYSEVVGSSGTRDSCGEPLVTSYNSCFMGTVDYIWRSEGLQTVKVLAPIPKDVMQPSGGFPTKKWGSDHVALATELAFTK